MTVAMDSALERLKAGNLRFTQAANRAESLTAPPTDLKRLQAGQAPYAVILGCSDSRVPPELVFNSGVGDLFVIRVAGNVATPSQIGSVEYACEQLGVELVVVLGHSGCGAVGASIDELKCPSDSSNSHVASILHCIEPAAQQAVDESINASDAQLNMRAVTANVLNSVEALKQQSEILGQRVIAGTLKIIGAEYAFDSGAVHFLE